MGRTVLAVIAGFIAASATFLLVESLGHQLFPFPADLELTNKEAMKAYMDSQPIAAYLLVWGGWLLGSLEAGAIAQFIAKARTNTVPAIIGGLLTAAAIVNFVMLPHAIWFIVLGLVTFIPAVFAGWKFAQRFTMP